MGIKSTIEGLYETIDAIEDYVPVGHVGRAEQACWDAIALLKARGPRQAHWEDGAEETWQACSFCGVAVKKNAVKWVKASEDENLNYCPHCGSRMSEEKKHDDPEEARLLTLEEVHSIGPDDTVVVEYRDCYPIGSFIRRPETYGKMWRCWTRQPTESQARLVKWDD